MLGYLMYIYSIIMCIFVKWKYFPEYKFLDRIIFPKDKIVNLAYEYILEQGEGKIIGNNFMKHYILA